MRNRVLEVFCGSVAVYITVAACSGAPGARTDGDKSPTPSAGRSGGANSEADGGASGLPKPVPDAHAAEDGTRIVNQYRVTSDGLRSPVGFWDTKLESVCSFLPTESGVERCLPGGAAVSEKYTGSPVYLFEDALCESPAGLIGTMNVGGACGDAFMTEVVPAIEEGCPEVFWRMYEIGATQEIVYAEGPGGCQEIEPPEGKVFVRAGARIPDSAFAKGEVVNGQ